MSEFTTIEKQAMKTSPCYGAIVQWKERVFVTDMDRYGKYSAKIYEMVDLGRWERRIKRGILRRFIWRIWAT